MLTFLPIYTKISSAAPCFKYFTLGLKQSLFPPKINGNFRECRVKCGDHERAPLYKIAAIVAFFLGGTFWALEVPRKARYSGEILPVCGKAGYIYVFPVRILPLE